MVISAKVGVVAALWEMDKYKASGGVDLFRRNFYSPLPHLEELPPDMCRRRSRMRAIGASLAGQPPISGIALTGTTPETPHLANFFAISSFEETSQICLLALPASLRTQAHQGAQAEFPSAVREMAMKRA